MSIGSRPSRLIITGGLFVVLVYALTSWILLAEQVRFRNAEIVRQLLTDARVLRDVVTEVWQEPRQGAVLTIVETLRDDDVLVALLGLDGRIILDATNNQASEDLVYTPEIRAAISAGWGTDTRAFGPEGEPHVVLAVRVPDSSGVTRGVVWVAHKQWSLAAHPHALGRLLAMAGAATIVGVWGLALLFLRLRRRVLQRVIDAARSLSAGNIGTELHVSEDDEFAELSTALNALRRRLGYHVEVIDRQRRMLQSLVDRLQEGVIVARPDGRIALINPTATRLLSINTAIGSLVDRSVEECIPHHPLQRLLAGEVPEEAISAEHSAILDPESPEIQVEIDTPDGPVHLLARSSEVVLAEPGKRTVDSTVGRVVMLTDITELQRNIQMRTDFVANASHELRTPLSTIRAAVETLLTMNLREEAPAAEMFLEKIDRHSVRLQAMVGDLLDLSRLETPTERFEPESVDIRRFLDDMHTRFAERFERKRLTWDAKWDPPAAQTIHVNPVLLRLALDNLVDNATKFTDEGGRISVELAIREDMAIFSVRDNGCGIPEAEAKRVFERFYQVQRARSGPERGTGLGLSIVRHAVGAMGGEVELESALGEGTCVRVLIPRGEQ